MLTDPTPLDLNAFPAELRGAFSTLLEDNVALTEDRAALAAQNAELEAANSRLDHMIKELNR